VRKVIVIAATVLCAGLLIGCGPGNNAGTGIASPPPTSVVDATTSTSTQSPSTTLLFIAPSTSKPTTPPTTTRPPAEEKEFLIQPGDEGVVVEQLQAQLKADGYDPGPIDGKFGPAVQAAVRAFQRVNDLDGDGLVGPLTIEALKHPKKVEPMRPDGPPDRVEVSISRKLLVKYVAGAPAIVTHISSGSEIPFCENGVCGDAVTPVGDFTAIMKIDGWEHGPLGDMFNSVYFWPAYAIHGSPYVPDVGMSHGCVRIPMHIAEYFPSMIKYGEPIYIMA
jgi:peptidoglycan hydrolase-like protein with peptidoglycan-binding domain